MKMRNCLCAALLAAAASLRSAELPSAFGVCAHLGGGQEHSKLIEELDLMQQAGIGWARADFTWAQIEPSENQFDFATYDRVVAEAEKRQVKILPILCYNSTWTKGFAHENLDAWGRFVRAVVSRYGDRLKHWEVWNEPNIGFWKPKPDPEQYTALLKVSYETIKAVDPALEVLYGGMAGVGHTFVEDTLKVGAGRYYDIMNIHPYNYPATIEQNDKLGEIDKLRAILRQYNASERLWITETGWPTHTSDVDIHAKFWTEMVVTAAKKRFPGRSSWRCAVVVDPTDSHNGMFATREAILAAVEQEPSLAAQGVSWAETGKLNPTETPILIALVGEHFPKNQYEMMVHYVRTGGLLVHIGGVPLYYADEFDEKVGGWQPQRDNAPGTYRDGLRIGWDAWWLNDQLPEKAEVTAAASADMNFAIPKNLATTRWFNDKRLKDGDELVPLLKASDKAGKFIGWPAALYLYNSDFTGGLLTACLPMATSSGVTWDVQGGRCPRAYLTYLQSGIEAFFWYEFRDAGTDPYYNEHHFGMIQLGLEPKPAYNALKYLTAIVGPKPQFTGKAINDNGVVSIGFKTATGEGMAVWNSFGPDKTWSMTLKTPSAKVKITDHQGKPIAISDHLVKDAAAPDGECTLAMPIGEAPIYILW